MAAGIPVIWAAHSGVYSFTRSCSIWNEGLTGVPSESLNSPSRKGSLPSVWVMTGLLVARSHHSLFWGSKQPSSSGTSVRTNMPNSSLLSFTFTNWPAFV